MLITIKRRYPESIACIDVFTDGQYPELTGSPKQIAWAEKIRKEYVADNVNRLHHIINLNPERYVTTLVDDCDAMATAIATVVNDNDSASFWIDNKYKMSTITKKLYLQFRK